MRPSERERVSKRERGKEGDFFSSCKPFQLFSGLRTETGSERRREATRLQEKKKERGKERRGTGIAWHFVSFSVRSQEQEKGDSTERSQREASLSRVCLLVKRAKTLPAKQSLDWSWEGCLGLCPLDTVPRLTALPYSPACLPGWSRIQPPPPRFFFCFIYPQMPSFTPASPPPRSCLLSVYCITSPLKPWMI